MGDQPLHRALGLTDDEYAADRTDPRPGAQPPRAGDVRGHVVGALLVQVVAAAPAPAADRGAVGARRPGRGRRRRRRRRRHRRRHPHREPQPPVGGRAVPGRGHRRRRHPARRLLGGRPPDRGDGPAAVRPARRRPQPLDRRRASCPGISGYGNAVGVPTVGGEVVFDETYADNPLVNVLCLGVLPTERLVLARATGVGNLAGAARLVDRSRRHRRCERARIGRASARTTTAKRARACRSAIRSRRSGSSRRASRCSTPAWPSACRTSAARASPAPRARRRPRAAPAWTCTSPRCPCANRTWSRSRS